MKKINKFILIDYENKNIEIKGLSDCEFLRGIYIALTESVEFDNVDLILYEDFIKHLHADLRRLKKFKDSNEFRFDSKQE